MSILQVNQFVVHVQIDTAKHAVEEIVHGIHLFSGINIGTIRFQDSTFQIQVTIETSPCNIRCDWGPRIRRERGNCPEKR